MFYLLSEFDWIWNSPFGALPRPYLSPLCITTIPNLIPRTAPPSFNFFLVVFKMCRKSQPIVYHHYSKPHPNPQEPLLRVLTFYGVFQKWKKLNLYSLLHIMQRQPGIEWWCWKSRGRASMQRRRYSLQRVSFGTRKRAEKIFREKRIFVCATNPALPLVHLLREEKTHFLWKFVTCSKILHFSTLKL